MKILFITPLFPEFLDEDRTKKTFALFDFVQQWRKYHDVQVVRAKRVKPYNILEIKWSSRVYEICDFQVLFVPIPDIQRIQFHAVSPAAFLTKRFLKKISFNPDVVVSHYHVGHLLGGMLAEKYSVPHAAGIHKRDIENLIRHERRFEKVFLQADLLAFRSQALLKSYTSLSNTQKTSAVQPSRRLCIAASGIGDVFYSLIPKSERKNPPRKSIRIVTVSSLKARKKIDAVLRALSKFRYMDWTYTIMGDGVERENLEELTKELQLSERVDFRGYVSHETVAGELSSYDLFVMISIRETFGLAYLEAMAAGCIVLGARDWGVDGIILDGKNGFLCDAEDEKELYDKLEQILSLDSERWSKILHNSLATVKEYSIEKRASLYLEQIEDISINKPGLDE